MNILNSIPLSALRAIEVIARTGSLKSASDELGVTVGALSQRLAKAESILGQSLFIRSSSGLEPTNVCAEFAPLLTRAMNDMSAAATGMRAVNDTVLTISVAPIFASRWLIWRIRKFNEQNPTISIRIEPTTEMVDLDRSEVDIGIRVGKDPALGVGAIKLLDQRVFPVCTPEMARLVNSPSDLLKLPVIRENDELYGWDVWLSEQSISNAKFKTGPTYADASLCLDGVMTGQGVFMAWETLACDVLRSGQVVSPFGQRTKTGATYWFATSAASANKPSVKKFKSWLDEELECFMEYWQSVDF